MAQPIAGATGTTVVFGTSGVVGYLISMDGAELTREVFDTTLLNNTSGYRDKDPGDLIDPGSSEVEFFTDTDVQLPISGAKEEIVATLPDGATITRDGFFNRSKEPMLEPGQLLRSVGTITWSGAPTYVDAP